jgi:hypothetical protein
MKEFLQNLGMKGYGYIYQLTSCMQECRPILIPVMKLLISTKYRPHAMYIHLVTVSIPGWITSSVQTDSIHFHHSAHLSCAFCFSELADKPVSMSLISVKHTQKSEIYFHCTSMQKSVRNKMFN